MGITLEWLKQKLADLQNDRTTAVINLGRVDGAIVTVNQMIAQLAKEEEIPDASEGKKTPQR